MRPDLYNIKKTYKINNNKTVSHSLGIIINISLSYFIDFFSLLYVIYHFYYNNILCTLLWIKYGAIFQSNEKKKTFFYITWLRHDYEVILFIKKQKNNENK
jgi:hypothetical protein